MNVAESVRPRTLLGLVVGLLLLWPLALFGAAATQLNLAAVGNVCVPGTCGAFTTFQSGNAYPFTVCAADPSGAIDGNYRGTITFSSTDPLGTFPATYTFTSADGGCHFFGWGVVTLHTLGTQTIFATDTAGGIGGSDTVTVYAAQPSSIPMTTPAGTFALVALLGAGGAWVTRR